MILGELGPNNVIGHIRDYVFILLYLRNSIYGQVLFVDAKHPLPKTKFEVIAIVHYVDSFI